MNCSIEETSEERSMSESPDLHNIELLCEIFGAEVINPPTGETGLVAVGWADKSRWPIPVTGYHANVTLLEQTCRMILRVRGGLDLIAWNNPLEDDTVWGLTGGFEKQEMSRLVENLRSMLGAEFVTVPKRSAFAIGKLGNFGVVGVAYYTAFYDSIREADDACKRLLKAGLNLDSPVGERAGGMGR